MWPDEWVEERAKWLEDLGFPVNGKSLWEADHIVPFALGGTDDLSNLVTLCVRCHRKKTDGQTGMLAKTARLSKSLPLKPGVKKVNPK
jgi:5-methylcytosine-specific restriction endonuclease McrA